MDSRPSTVVPLHIVEFMSSTPLWPSPQRRLIRSGSGSPLNGPSNALVPLPPLLLLAVHVIKAAAPSSKRVDSIATPAKHDRRQPRASRSLSVWIRLPSPIPRAA